MLAWIGWILAALFGIGLLLVRSSWQNAVIKSSLCSEFLAIVFIDETIYKNNRKAFLSGIHNEKIKEVDANPVAAVSIGASNVATSYIMQLGPTVGLQAILSAQANKKTDSKGTW